MWVRLAGVAFLSAAAACASNSEQGAASVATDTVVTTRSVEDTTLVSTDTTVTVDTTTIEGGEGVVVDTSRTQ